MANDCTAGATGETLSARGVFWSVHHLFNRLFERLRFRYIGLLDWSLEHRARVLAAFMAFSAGSLGLVSLVGEDFFPNVDSGQMRLEARAPAGTRLEQTEVRFAAIEREIEPGGTGLADALRRQGGAKVRQPGRRYSLQGVAAFPGQAHDPVSSFRIGGGSNRNALAPNSVGLILYDDAGERFPRFLVADDAGNLSGRRRHVLKGSAVIHGPAT